MKKRTKKINFYLSIIEGIRQNKSPSKIAKELGISIQSLNYYIKDLKKEGYITKRGYGVWGILKELKKSSIGTRDKPVTNLHAFNLIFPILSGKIEDSEWEIKEKLNHWIPKYKKLETLGGITIKNNNNKSISVFVKSRDIKNLSEIHNLAFKIRAYLQEYFKLKYNVILDIFNCETKALHLATEDRDAEEMLSKGETYKLKLGKKARKIFKKDNMDAYVELDNSPYPFSAETNDLDWKKSYIQMPFTIKGLAASFPLLADYNKNLKLHIKVQEQTLVTLKKIQEQL